MIMKKLLHITYTLVALLALAGCERENLVPVEPTPDVEGKVTLNGSLSVPVSEDAAWTKSFGEFSTQTGITHLYVAVFNEADILIEVVEARPGTKEHPLDNFTPGDAASNFKTVFHVTLTEARGYKRILHFIGTSKERQDLLAANIVDESSYVKTLIATGKEDCYWGRKEFDDGITEGDEYIPCTDIKNIPLVRNFVKVKVNSSDAKFTIKSFKVFNVPKSGTIAPFNPNTPEYTGTPPNLSVNLDRFADYAMSGITYQNMSSSTGQHYEGYMPSGVEYDDLMSLPAGTGKYGYNASGNTDNDFVSANFIDAAGADYLYEATHYENEKNPFIIIKGSYNGGSDTYYKADFVYLDSNAEKQPYHLLRNFQYTLEITQVSANGASTIYEAVNGIAFNNFEASTQSQYLTNISDGDSRLFMSTTDEMIVRGTTFTMYVKSLRKSGSSWVNDNANISVKALKHVSGNDDIVSAKSNVVIGSTDVTYNGEDDWRKVTITVKDAATLNEGEVLKQTIVFKNRGADQADGDLSEKADDLTRNLNLTLRRPMSLTVNAQDYVPGDKAGYNFTVDFSIPSGLTEFRFPMDFYIEQQDNTLYPDYLPASDPKTLSVVTGKSKIPGQTNKNTYYYKRTLDWDEYRNATADINGIKTFTSYFKTLVAASATRIWVFPDDANNYFDTWDSVNGVYTNQDEFVNTQGTGVITFERSTVLLSLDEGRTTTYNLGTANSGAVVSYTSADPTIATVGINSGLITAMAVGVTTITATCEAYGAYTAASATFTVEVLSSGGLDIKWSSEPSRVLLAGNTGSAVAVATPAGGAALSGSVTYASSNTSVATIASDGTITAAAAGTTVITATAKATVGGHVGTFEQSISYTLTVVAAAGDVLPGTEYHIEKFTNGDLGDYTVQGETGDFITTTGNSVWSSNGQYGVRASSWITDAFVSAEAMLVSKSLNLSATDGAVLKFNHTANYFDDSSATSVLDQMKACLTLWYSIDGGSSWTQITIPDDQYPTGTSWASQNTNIALPAAVNGQSNVKIAFKYVSGTYHGQWQIKNLTITEN